MLAVDLAEPDLGNLRALLIDKKSVGKYHSYLTVVLDGQTGELLHTTEGLLFTDGFRIMAQGVR